MNRQEFNARLERLGQQFRAQIEAQVTGFDANPAASLARREQALADFAYFAQTYFPHYLKKPPAELHRYLFTRLPQIIGQDKGAHEAIAAPRGHAKSTLISQIFVLWCVVTRRKHYIILIMDAFEQAATMLEAIKAELACNARLLMDFVGETGESQSERQNRVITQSGVKIEVFGSGKKLRGRRHGPHRPDLVICDDLENDENVRNPQQRDKLEQWLQKTVLSLGATDDSMDVIVIGTLLHYDSLLSRLLANPLWTRKTFRAVNQWPARMDLWERWQECLLNEGQTEALAFYQRYQAEMEQGAVLGWPEGQPLYTLMTKRARDGLAAFDSEMQNDPLQGDNAPFAHAITFWVSQKPHWVFFGACDPSLGRAGQGRDPSAILIGGYDRQSGVLDVVEASIKKRLPDVIISEIIALQRQYHCAMWGIEAVQFQEFLRTELIKRGQQAGVPIPARAVLPRADKALRIESLQPPMAAGLIRLHASQSTLIQQLKHFPLADHDDGPDALHMLWMLATTGSAPIEATLVARRSGARGRFAESQHSANGWDDGDVVDNGGRFGGRW